VVLCGGIGFRAAQDLQANGIRPAVVASGSVEQAVMAFVSGQTASGPFCCHHE
jgi:predicted Fe-Mo cluster-binding NifX family protein